MTSRTGAALIMLLAGALASFMPSAGASELASYCATSIVMFPASLTAEVTSTEPAAVTFQGNITMDKPAAARGVVSLSATVSTGWAFSLAPSSMTFAGGATQQSFAATVVVPSGTRSTEAGQLTVTAQGTVGGIQCPPSQANGVVEVAAYYGLARAELSPTSTSARGSPASATFNLNISWDTNTADSATVSLSADLPPGATTNLPSSVVATRNAAGALNATLSFRVNVQSLGPGTYPIKVHARFRAEAEASSEATVQVPERSTPSLLMPGAPAVAIAIGAFLCRRHRPKA